MTVNYLKIVLAFVRAASMHSQIKTSRSKSDFLADRIRQCSSAPTILDFAEQLAKALDSETEHLSAVTGSITRIPQNEGQRILIWLRQRPRVAAMIVFLKQDDFNETADLALNTGDIDCLGDKALPSRPYQINIRAACLSPLSHGSDEKSGNATLFRRMAVLCQNDKVLYLPFVSGNSIRGIVRDLLADDLLSRLGIEARRDKPNIALWFFHALYSGGALEEGGNKLLDNCLGKAGASKAEGIKEFRTMFPVLSALGSALGSRILSGRAGAKFGDWKPECREWNNGNDNVGVDSLFEWLYLTRREDHEGHDDHRGMIANTEVLKEGTVLIGGVDFDRTAPVMERAVIEHGLMLLEKHGYIGANNRQGYGKVNIGTPDPKWCVLADDYVDYIETNKNDILKYIEKIGGFKDAQCESDSSSVAKKSKQPGQKSDKLLGDSE